MLFWWKTGCQDKKVSVAIKQRLFFTPKIYFWYFCAPTIAIQDLVILTQVKNLSHSVPCHDLIFSITDLFNFQQSVNLWKIIEQKSKCKMLSHLVLHFRACYWKQKSYKIHFRSAQWIHKYNKCEKKKKIIKVQHCCSNQCNVKAFLTWPFWLGYIFPLIFWINMTSTKLSCNINFFFFRLPILFKR